MKRPASIALLAVLALAGCGGAKTTTGSTTTATTSPVVPSPLAAMNALIARNLALAGKVTVLYQGSSFSVVQSVAGQKAQAVVFRLSRNHWLADRTGQVKISILGPQPNSSGAPAIPQVAIEFTAPTAFLESALWIDGRELIEKGGGSPNRGTIYGAPTKALKAGVHVAVGYASTATTGSAVAWLFKVG